MLFKLGATAAARAGKCAPRYVCPICLSSFHRFDPKVLTVEHVPAEALGGKRLLLTCRDCNSIAGEALQSDQVSREQIETFWRGERGRPLNFEAQTQHGKLRGEIEQSDSGIARFRIQNPRTAPNVLNSFYGAEDQALVIQEYKIGRSYSWASSRIADLRDAYLWIFAQYGYRFVAFEAFDWVRSAIRNGSATNNRWGISLRARPEVS